MPRPALVYALHAAIIAAPGRYASVFLSARGLSVPQVGAVLALPAALSLLALAPAAAAADRKGARVVLRTGFAVSTAAFAVLALLPKVGGWGGFLLSSILFAVFKVARSPAHPILDAYGLEWLRRGAEESEEDVECERERKMQFGRERVWGSISMGFWSMVIGVVSDRVGQGCSLYFNMAATVCMLILIHWFWETEEKSGCENSKAGVSGMDVDGVSVALNKVEVDTEKTILDEDAREGNCSLDLEQGALNDRTGTERTTAVELFLTSIREPRSAIFLLTCVAISIGTALVDDLLFLFLVGDLKASNVLCGISLAVTVVFEIPLMYWGGFLLQRFGARNLMVMGMAAYAFRVVVYTLLDENHAWYILLVEPLHGVTYALVQVARVQEASDFAPSHLQATAQSLVAVSATLGSLAGTLGGSYVMHKYGSVVTYRSAAALVSSTATLYYASRVFLVQKKPLAPSASELAVESCGVDASD